MWYLWYHHTLQATCHNPMYTPMCGGCNQSRICRFAWCFFLHCVGLPCHSIHAMYVEAREHYSSYVAMWPCVHMLHLFVVLPGAGTCLSLHNACCRACVCSSPVYHDFTEHWEPLQQVCPFAWVDLQDQRHDLVSGHCNQPCAAQPMACVLHAINRPVHACYALSKAVFSRPHRVTDLDKTDELQSPFKSQKAKLCYQSHDQHTAAVCVKQRCRW